MSLLARTYTAKNERGKMIGLCLGMIGIGTAAGPPYGSVMNAFAGKAATFLTLAGIIASLGIFQLLYTGLKIEKNNEGKRPTAIWDLLKDVYILIALGALVIVGLLFGGINGTFTSWLIGRFNPFKWQLGLAYLPFSAAYGLTANLINFVPLMSWRGLVPILGFVVSCVGLISLPFSSSFFATFGSTLVLGFGTGLTDGIIFPDMATLVDIRHTSGYGSIYALADIAINVGLIAGPFLASGIVRVLSFPWAMWILAIICFVYTPCLIAPWYMMKQHQQPTEETEILLNGSRRPSNQPTSNNN
ncbi:unnamed protein product [Clavelina lepadiformis]|uniref:Major facilitator superfamily (MFS) profile domain-containing protein n=1 Tax=Clavelina lepadiformis TaxID=159417 RepID=A0ABP0G837_CLALP